MVSQFSLFGGFPHSYSANLLYLRTVALQAKQYCASQIRNTKSESEKVAMMPPPYTTVARVLSPTDDPQMQRIRKILMIIHGVGLVSVVYDCCMTIGRVSLSMFCIIFLGSFGVYFDFLVIWKRNGDSEWRQPTTSANWSSY